MSQQGNDKTGVMKDIISEFISKYNERFGGTFEVEAVESWVYVYEGNESAMDGHFIRHFFNFAYEHGWTASVIYSEAYNRLQIML